MRSEYPDAEWIEVHPPDYEHGSYAANSNPDASTLWKMDYRYFDQYTLEELPVDHVWNRFHEASFGDKLQRMNYDIHVGAIGGLAGKTLAFFSQCDHSFAACYRIFDLVGEKEKVQEKTGCF